MYHFHLQGGKSAEQETIVAFSRWLGLATHWFLTRLIFDPEDGGDTLLWNVDLHTKMATFMYIINLTIPERDLHLNFQNNKRHGINK
jgi:hypothetical protein